MLMNIAAPKLEPIRRRLESFFRADAYGEKKISGEQALRFVLDDKGVYGYLRSIMTSTKGLALGVSDYTENKSISPGNPLWIKNYLIYGLIAPKEKTKLFILHANLWPQDFHARLVNIYPRNTFFRDNEKFGNNSPLKYQEFSGWPSAQKLLVQTYAALKNPDQRMLDLSELSLRLRDTRIDVKGLEEITKERLDRIEGYSARKPEFSPFQH